MFIHSNKKYTERSMYLIDPYRIKQPVSLGFEAFVAPANFDRTAQPVNIYEVFKAYYSNNQTAKYIYSFSDAYNTLTLSAGTGISYRYGYTRAGVDYVFDVNSVVNPFSATTDTKRWIIVKDASSSTVSAVLPIGAVWAYLGDKVTSIAQMHTVDTVKYIHMSNLNSITSFSGNNFDRCTGLTGILTIPNSITTIAAVMFRSCPNLIGELVIPNSVTAIADYAFNGCTGFTSLSLSNSLLSIQGLAFSNCTGLTGTLTLPNSLISIGVSAFERTRFTGLLSFPDSLLNIADSAFCYCNQLTGNIVIPNSVTSLAGNIFNGCTLLNGSITIGTGIVANGLGEGLLYGSKFTSLFGGNNNYSIVNNIVYIKTSGVETKCLGTTNSLIQANSTLNLLTTITSIGANAFFACTHYVGTLTIPSVTSIKDGAFSGCSGFTGTLTILPSVTTLGSSSFSGCSGFTGTLTIPPSVTTLGSYGFDYCSGFTGILVIPSSITSIPSVGFRYTHFTEIVLPSSVTTVSGYAFNGCTYLTKISANRTVPPNGLDDSTFNGVNLNTCILHTPVGSLAAYRAANIWKNFVNIIEDL